MNNFKGTTEEWKIDSNIIFADDYFQTHIAILPENYSPEIVAANGLLITKAHKMLEMLIKIFDSYQSGDYPTEYEYDEIKNLIKEATEL